MPITVSTRSPATEQVTPMMIMFVVFTDANDSAVGSVTKLIISNADTGMYSEYIKLYYTHLEVILSKHNPKMYWNLKNIYIYIYIIAETKLLINIF